MIISVILYIFYSVKSLYHRSALLQMNKRMNEEKSALPMTRGQIENFIKRNGKTYFTALFTTSQLRIL